MGSLVKSSAKKKIFKKNLKKKLISLNSIYFLDSNLYSLNKFSFKNKYCLKLQVKSNNIFATFIRLISGVLKVIKIWSCGLENCKSTKRSVKFALNFLINSICIKLRRVTNFIVCIKSPRYLYKFIIKKFKSAKRLPLLFIFDSLKIFNGCRAKKKRRKKYQKFRALK